MDLPIILRKFMRKFNTQNMAVKFYLDKRPSKISKEYPIRVSVCIKGTTLISTIGYSVAKNALEGGRITKKGYKNAKGYSAKDINTKLSGLEYHFAQYELDLKHKPTKEELKQQIALSLKKTDGDEEQTEVKPLVPTITLQDRLDEFIAEQGAANQWTVGMVKCWNAFKKHMEEFRPDALLDYFNEAGLIAYVAFLRTTCNMEERTVEKQYAYLKWFMNWAIRKGYTKETTINTYKPKFKVLEKPVIFLTKDELLTLYRYEIPANGTKVDLVNRQGEKYQKIIHDASALAKTKDLFCFCAFTSLRYSDMAKLKRHDIRNGILHVTTQKTNDRIPIEINSFAQEILDKYKDEKHIDDLALPVITNQKMNKYLKDLCELCGFNEPITTVCFRGGKREEVTSPKYALMGTHAGRRTFICFALSSGIPPQVVMKWTGHSDYAAMKPYIDIAEKTKANAMKLFEMEMKK